MKVEFSASHVNIAILMLLTVASPVLSDPDFKFTKIVDLNSGPDANFDSIQDAIDNIPDDPPDKWTVLIYAGVYTENVTLDGSQENISLLGVDSGSVIIAPTSGDGVVITSGAETSRNNAIRNLTIRTTSGHGVKIVKGGTPLPSDIQIEGVTIEADGAAKDGILIEDGKNILIQSSNISSDDNDALNCEAVDQISIVESRLTALRGNGVNFTALTEPYEDVTITNSTLIGGKTGMRIFKADRVLIQGCDIVADNTVSAEQNPVGLFLDRLGGGSAQPPSDVVVLDCRVKATCDAPGTGSPTCIGVQTDVDTSPRVIDCDISANSDEKPVYGVFAGNGGSTIEPNIFVIGGTVVASCEDERETEVFDLRQNDPRPGSDGFLYMSGTRMTKWKGPIKTAERKRSVVQRTLDIGSPGSATILATTDLTGSQQSLTTGFSNPDVYRVLSITGKIAGMDQDVYIVGTNFGGEQITDKITMNGTSTVDGVKPFAAVTKIILPAQTAQNQQVQIGTSGKIGLQFPIESSSDIVQVSRKASAATSYTVLASIGTVDAEYSTADITGQLTAVDSFEFVALASE